MLSYLITMVRAREDGQSLAEYALILALIAILCVGALTALQGGIDTILTNIATALTGA